jgi:hypothetical protein
MDRCRTAIPWLTGILVTALALAACTSGTGTSPSPVPSSPPASSPDPSPADPGGVVPDPDGSLVFPKPGVIDPRPVAVETISASLEGGRVVVRLEWTSGVEPCYTLAGVDIARDGDTFILTVLEGTTDPDAACIEIAMFKATLVDLGVLPAGEYTIQTDPAATEAATISVP